MKDDDMSLLLRRTCSTCCAYSGGECMDRVSFIVPGGHARDPLANDVCHAHMTQRESDAEDAAIVMFWRRLAIELQLCLADDGDGIQVRNSLTLMQGCGPRAQPRTNHLRIQHWRGLALI